MKQLLYILLAVTLFTACSSDDENDIDNSKPIQSITLMIDGKPLINAKVYVLDDVALTPGTGSRYIGNRTIELISTGATKKFDNKEYTSNNKGVINYELISATEYTICADKGTNYYYKHVKQLSDTIVFN